jgi:hypothetical protein
MTQSPAEFGAFIRGEIAKRVRVADAVGLRGNGFARKTSKGHIK